MEKHKKKTENEDLKRIHCSILMEEVREKMRKLRDYGMKEKEIVSHLLKEQPLIPLIVSKNYRIFLGEERVEIRMEPLVKAVYLLFLRHPEGIIFKHLPDYRKELMEIYKVLKPNGLTRRTRKSIEDVTNPCLNSINEKCARIRGAFITQFDEELAKFYYIDGRRGEPKSIGIDRSLVEWEIELR